jgi:CoA:oxalate CoA-transferase
VTSTVAALSGIKVLELGHAISAPHCAQILADQGADVIRVEPPGGDLTRGALPRWEGESLYFASHNRRKRSIIVDLKSPTGREVFLKLAAMADVIITNYSASVPDRLGVGYEDVRAINQRIVFVHITGFGHHGPYSDFGAYDGIIQAMSGVPSLTGEPGGEPVFVGAFVADHLAATQAALAAMLALYRRNATGRGEFVSISMLEGYMNTLAHHIGDVLETGSEVSAHGNQVPTAFANTFRAADGYVYIAPLSSRAWSGFCRAIEAPDWLRDADRRWTIQEGRGECEKLVEEWTRARTRKEIVARLSAAGVPCGPVNGVAEAVSQPALEGRDAVTKVRLPSGRLASVPGPEVRLEHAPDHPSEWAVPGPGQHTREVLLALGYAEGEIAEMETSGTIEIPKPTTPGR